MKAVIKPGNVLNPDIPVVGAGVVSVATSFHMKFEGQFTGTVNTGGVYGTVDVWQTPDVPFVIVGAWLAIRSTCSADINPTSVTMQLAIMNGTAFGVAQVLNSLTTASWGGTSFTIDDTTANARIATTPGAALDGSLANSGIDSRGFASQPGSLFVYSPGNGGISHNGLMEKMVKMRITHGSGSNVTGFVVPFRADIIGFLLD